MPQIVITGGTDSDRSRIMSSVAEYFSHNTDLVLCDDTLAASTVELRDDPYDAVILLDTDDRLLDMWTGHPHLRIVADNGTIEERIRRVEKLVSNILGVEKPIEVERKYLVERVGDIPHSRTVEISQTYLLPVNGQERRIRRRGEKGQYIYFLTSKQRIAADRSYEFEERISEGRYNELMAEANPAKRTVRKLRTCFVWENQYFELDEFVEPKIDHLLLEIEDAESPEDVAFPPFLRILKDVTDDPHYKNSNLAVI